MKLSEYPDSFKESKDFYDIQKNPFRQISANLLDAIDEYFTNIDDSEQIKDMKYYNYEYGLTSLLFDERKKSEKRILSRNGKLAKYIKGIFNDYGFSEKDFDKFFKMLSSVDNISEFFEEFLDEYL